MNVIYGSGEATSSDACSIRSRMKLSKVPMQVSGSRYLSRIDLGAAFDIRVFVGLKELAFSVVAMGTAGSPPQQQINLMESL